MTDRWIEWGPGQLARIHSPARKYGQDGSYILPAPGVPGDGHGLLVWVEASFIKARELADPFNWYDLPGGDLEARWEAKGHGRDYAVIRRVRRKGTPDLPDGREVIAEAARAAREARGIANAQA